MNILSIQSSVAYGHVGNSAAVFPLQRLGHTVWPVDTVQFSNHTGYGQWRGPIFSAHDVASVIAGIAERGVWSRCDGILSGYMGDAAIGTVILDAVAAIRKANPRALYCCDPVIGDVGRGVFVRPGIPKFMRDRSVPAADIITPNQFELEYLTGRAVATLDQAIEATAAARALGPRVVMVTSLMRREAPEDTIEMLADSAEGAWLVATPRLKLDPLPNGAGDVVAALFLATYLETMSVSRALGDTAARIFAVFDATRRAGGRELALIAAQDEIAKPSRRFDVMKLR
ncbi:MAG: pyridoxal kinase PdxY [Alphaproteobacteria bacterium]|nr:pyridoxal kinase PdxY [Alphaproteobacteria bacterium]